MPPVPHDKIKYIKPVPVLPCNNLDVTIQFWVQLGWKLSGKHPGFASVIGGENACCNLYYRERNASAWHFELGGPAEIFMVLETGEADALFKLLSSLPEDEAPTYGPNGGDKCEGKPWGFRQFTLLDPDGNRIHFASHLTDEEYESQAPEVPATAVPSED